MARPSKQKQMRREALRDQLKGQAYLKQIHKLLEKTWGDEVAENNAKLNHYLRLLGKVLPDAKDEVIMIDIDVSKPLSEQAQQVLQSVTSGKITPSVGDVLLNQISRVSSIRIDDDLEERIKALEKEFADD